MAKRDYYQVLGVSQNATQDEVKKAYKRQAKQHHPDRNRGEKNAEERFKEVSEAYQVLSDPQKKQHYDLFGHNGVRNGSGYGTKNPGADSTGGFHRSSGPHAAGFGFEDVHGDGARFENIFNEIFGGARRNKRRTRDFSGAELFDSGFSRGPVSGLDMEAEVTIGFEDAIKGGKHRISIQRDTMCFSCKGTGKNQSGASITCTACNGTGGQKVANGGTHIKVICTSCSGTGQIYTESCPGCDGSGTSTGMETMTVNIPPGVNDGGRLRIPGKGGMGPEGRSGNLYLRIHITPHRFFKREGNTLHLDLPVSISEAVLGGRVEVPTLDGKATLKVPPHTQNGAVLRMKGKGVPDPKGGAPGDMLVRIQVAVPTSADARTKKFYEELKDLEPDPRRGMF